MGKWNDFTKWLFLDEEENESQPEQEQKQQSQEEVLEENKEYVREAIQGSFSASVAIVEELRLANDIKLYELDLKRENFDENGRFKRD